MIIQRKTDKKVEEVRGIKCALEFLTAISLSGFSRNSPAFDSASSSYCRHSYGGEKNQILFFKIVIQIWLKRMLYCNCQWKGNKGYGRSFLSKVDTGHKGTDR